MINYIHKHHITIDEINHIAHIFHHKLDLRFTRYLQYAISNLLPEIEFDISDRIIKFHTEEDLFRFNMWIVSLGI